MNSFPTITKRLALAIGIFSLIGQNPAPAAEQPPHPAPRVYVDASSNNFPPVNLLDASGALDGFGRELSEAVVGAAGGTVRHIHSARWIEVLDWLDSGKADFIHDAGYTEERKSYLDYTAPILQMPERIFVDSERYDIRNFQSLAGKKVACVEEHITHIYLRQFPEITCHVVKRPIDGIYALIEGEADAFIYPKQIALHLAQQRGLRHLIKMIGSPLRTLAWHMTVKKGNTAMAAFLDKGIAKVRADGTYDRIYRKWFGEKLLAGFSKREVQLLVTAAIAISLILAAAVFLLFYAHHLRRHRSEIMAQAITQNETSTALRQSEERFRQMAENIREVFWMTDPNKQEMLYISPAYEEIWGRTCTSLYEHPGSFVAAIHPDDRRNVVKAFEKQTAGTYDEIYRIIRSDGMLRWIRDRAFPVRNDRKEVIRIVGIAEDITDNKNAELATQETKQRYENIFDGTAVSIWDEDLSSIKMELDRLQTEGVQDLRAHLEQNPELVLQLLDKIRVNDVNKATLRLFGAGSKQEMIKSIGKTFVTTSGQTFINELCAIWNGEDGFQAETRLRSLDGRDLHAIISLPIPKSLGEFRHIPVSIIDITALKSLEDQLQHTRKLEVVGQLAGGIAHDFNNLLTIIMGNIELATTAMTTGEKQSVQNLDRAMTAARRGASLTHRLLAFSRKQDLMATNIDLNRLIIDVEDLLQRTLGETIKIETQTTDGPCLCRVDPAEFEHVLINLAINARDAMRKGGAVTIKTEIAVLGTAEAALAEVEPGEYVALSVTDDGTGMSAEVLEHVFEPFFTTKEAGGGSGLGLSMAYGFAKQSGGHMTIDTAVGQGTTVRILLPRTRQVDEIKAQTSENQPFAVEGKTIMVVEDDDDLREVVVWQLQKLGFSTLMANDGNSGLDLLRTEKDIDLLLTDIVLPGGITGIEMVTKARDFRDDLRVIFMTGYTEQEMISWIEADSGNSLIWKPFTTDEIFSRIRDVMTD